MKKQIKRFAVGSPSNLQSFIWRFWVHGDDVYLGASNAFMVFKVSLHKSGIWRIAFVDELEREDSSEDRVIKRWTRPTTLDNGWTPSVGILVSSIFPSDKFNHVTDFDNRIEWFNPPAVGKKLLFKVMFSTPEMAEADRKEIARGGGQLVCFFSKMNKEKVWIVLVENDMSSMEENNIKDDIKKIKIHLKTESDYDSVFSSRAISVISDDKPTALTQPTLVDIPLGKENLTFESPSLA